MREIKKLDVNQVRDALKLAEKAYPMMDLSSEEKLQGFVTRIQENFNQNGRIWYGLFEDGHHLGNMVIYDYVTNYYGKELKAKGIGFVAVDFLHKKQRICKDMLEWFLEHTLKDKYPMAMLYAFRPDFYKKMGFGFGTNCFNYVTTPSAMPRSKEVYSMNYLDQNDLSDFIAFYKEFYQKYHGMILKKDKDLEMQLNAPGFYHIGYRENGKLTGLLSFRLVSNESTNNETDMFLSLLYTTPDGLKASLNFLNSQSDQVRQIHISTLFKDLHYNFNDIRHNDHKILSQPGYHHTYDSGMGIMYRSLNPVELIMNRPSTLDNIKIRFNLQDTFMVNTKKEFIIEWNSGKAVLSKGKKFDLELTLDVSDFSSWVMNSVDLTALHDFGLLETNHQNMILSLDQAFYYPRKPICLERF